MDDTEIERELFNKFCISSDTTAGYSFSSSSPSPSLPDITRKHNQKNYVEVDSTKEDPPSKKKKNTNTRRPSYKPEFMRGLRILRSDIRRKYSEMYTNVINSLDPHLMSQFFYQFCAPNFRYERRRDETCEIKQFATTLAPKPIIGVTQYIQSVVAFFTPTILIDLIVRVQNAKVIVTKGISGSRIVADDRSELTMLYSIERIPTHNHDFQTRLEDRKEFSRFSSSTSSLPSQVFEVTDPISNDRICFSLLPKPIRIKFNVELTFILDDSHLITALYVTHK